MGNIFYYSLEVSECLQEKIFKIWKMADPIFNLKSGGVAKYVFLGIILKG